jgi:hypothetical protein
VHLVLSSDLPPTSMLVTTLQMLPAHEVRCFIKYLERYTIVRLSACCCLLRSTLCSDNFLWRQFYHTEFITGLYTVKELEFVRWCGRTGSSADSSDILNTLNWYDVCRRRVCTQHNWRYGNTKRITLPLPDRKDISGWWTSNKYITAVGITDSLDWDSYNSSINLETKGHSPVVHSFDNNINPISRTSTLAKLKCTREDPYVT